MTYEAGLSKIGCVNHDCDKCKAPAQPAIGDIRALKHRIHELEGEVLGYKRILDAAPTAPAQPLSLEDSLAVAKSCCGEYASCNRPCTPRGRWEAQQAQQPLTDDEIIKLADYHTTYQIESPSTSGMIDFARAAIARATGEAK